jgi:hypothetical protein
LCKRECTGGTAFQLSAKSVFGLDKALRVLSETEILKPTSDLLRRGSAPDYRASKVEISLPSVLRICRKISSAITRPLVVNKT